MKFNVIKKLALLSVCGALVLSSICPKLNISAAEAPALPTATVKNAADGSYKAYIAEGSAEQYAKNSMTVSADKLSGAGIKTEDLYGKTAAVWSGEGSVTAELSVETAGFYNLSLEYASVAAGVDFDFGVKLDGKYPFKEAEKISFSRFWENKTDKIGIDSMGNEISPEQSEIKAFNVNKATDETGVVTEPYLFYLTAGMHKLELVGNGQKIAIASVSFTAPEKAKAYSEISKTYDLKKSDNEIIYIQGEKADIKTGMSIIPKSDSGISLTPSDATKNVLNYIGGTSWQSPTQRLVWKFNVEKAGYYSLDFHYRQSDVVNAESWRSLKIDGVSPFKEAASLRFPYAASWDYYSFGDGEKDYYIWLDAKEHTLSLEVTLGDMAAYYERLSDIVAMLGDKYIDIVKITGSTPDPNLDYELFRQIPDLNDTLKAAREDLTSLVDDLKSFTGKRGSQYIAAMNNMARVLKMMLDAPYVAQDYVKDYYSNYTSLSSWLNDMKNMPLHLDEIQLVPYGKETDEKGGNIFTSILYTFKRLASSFASDYITEDKGDKALNLWVNWGRDQAGVLEALINNSFTPSTGIEVNLKITNAGLAMGILSGNAPDMAIYQSRTEPINLGMRGALYDLSRFEDIDTVLSRFQKGAEIPYKLGDALYAIPDTQSCYLMFYRTDIFENLGLTVPTTWDEFLYTSSIIQRNNMGVYVPYTTITASTTVNAGIGSLNLFATLLGQNGLSMYNKELNATALSAADSVNVFDYWVKFYKDYDFLKEADFYNRFRVGVMPLGISTAATYTTLYSAAPEIVGRWAVATVPGTVGGDSSVAGSGTGCSILEASKNKEAAWEFLKWWTSADTQIRYSNNVEAILGMLGRPSCSNVEAYSSLAWEKKDLEVIMEQWSRVKEVPEVPGSYYVCRALDQAFWAVINDGTNPKDALVKWSKIADAEIERKIEEYR